MLVSSMEHTYQFTQENPAYFYMFNYRVFRGEPPEIQVVPICDFRPLNLDPSQVLVRIANPSEQPCHKAMYYIVGAEPYTVSANKNRSLFSCWAPENNSSLARMSLLEEVLAYSRKRIVDLCKQLDYARAKQDIIESLILEERRNCGQD